MLIDGGVIDSGMVFDGGSGMCRLRFFQKLPGGENGSGLKGISPSGRLAAGWTVTGNGQRMPAVWSNDTLLPNVIPNLVSGHAVDVSDDGYVVGQARISGGTPRAFRAALDGSVQFFDQTEFTKAFDGNEFLGKQDGQATLWLADGGVLQFGAGSAIDMSPAGLALTLTTASGSVAALGSQDGGMERVQTSLTLTVATAVGDHAQLAGYYSATGQRPFVWTPDGGLVPLSGPLGYASSIGPKSIILGVTWNAQHDNVHGVAWFSNGDSVPLDVPAGTKAYEFVEFDDSSRAAGTCNDSNGSFACIFTLDGACE